MPERTRRIIESAIELADKGGFQAVRLRDVAAHSGVALGTLYTRFRSKEEILVAALQDEAAKLEQLLVDHPMQGDSALERTIYFFTLASRLMFNRPNFARAVLRSVASGEAETAAKVLSFHRRITRMVMASGAGATGGQKADTSDDEDGSPEAQLAFLLQQVWFATLVGWMGGLNDEEQVIESMERAARILFAGINAVDAAAKAD